MRKAFPIFLILVLACLQPCFSNLAGGETSEPSVECSHGIEFVEGGVLLVNDTLIFSSPDNASVVQLKEFFIGFPAFYGIRMDHYEVYELTNGAWVVPEHSHSETQEGMTGVKILFVDPILLGNNTSKSISAVFVFSGLFAVSSQEMLVAIPLFPATSTDLSSCLTEVRLPPGATPNAVSPNVLESSIVNGVWILRNKTLSLPKYQNVSAIVDYYVGTSSSFVCDLEGFDRNIDLDSVSSVKIQDTFTLRNLGASMTYYPVRLPVQAFDVRARDLLGETQFYSEKKENATYQTFYVWPRTGIKQGERWIFTVEYSVPSAGLLEPLGNGYNFSHFILPDVNYTVRSLEVTISLPEGAELVESIPEPEELEKTGSFSWELVYTAKNVTFLQDSAVQAVFDYSPIWLAFRPTVWAILISAAIAVVVGLARHKTISGEEKVVVEPSLLRRLVDLYEQKLTLDSQSDQLDEDLENRRISRAEHNRRRDAARSRALDVEGQIKSIKDKLRQELPSVEASLREIEVSEIEVQTERNNLRELETRLRNRGVARDAYNRLRQEYLNRIRRARSRIQRTVLSLRERSY